MPVLVTHARALARPARRRLAPALAWCRDAHRRHDRLDLVGMCLALSMLAACLVSAAVEVVGSPAAQATAAAPVVGSRRTDAVLPRLRATGASPAVAAAIEGPATTTTAASTTTAAPPPTTVPPDPGIAAPARYTPPAGKGMWIWQPEAADGGDPNAIVARAQAVGLTHIYVRTGSTKSGFHGQAFLDQIVPVAHAAGLQVFGWDFPYLHDPGQDIERALAAIGHVTPGGHQIDGFVPDIETPAEGTNLSWDGVTWYLAGLRAHLGPDYPLVAAVPRPSDSMQTRFPYDAVMPHVTAVAPMVYWLNRQPDSDVAHTLAFFAAYGKPVVPIGQAYDGAPEGGRPGVPPPDEIERFLGAAEQGGAPAVSFWSWQHADSLIWDTLATTPTFRAP